MADPKRVLVIAEDPQLRDAITRLLLESGCCVQAPTSEIASARSSYSHDAIVEVDAGLASAIQSETPSVARVSSDVLEAMVDHACVSLTYLDPEFRIVWANGEYCRRCGLTREQVLGHSHFELVVDAEHREVCERVRDEGVPYRARGKALHFSNQLERGETLWDWALNPVRSADGRVVGLVLALTEAPEDASAMAEAQEQKALAEHCAAELDAVFAALSDPAVVYDGEGRPVRANAAAVASHGFEGFGADAANSPPRVLMCLLDGTVPSPEHLPANRALRGETVRDQKFIISDAQGRDGVILASASPLSIEGEVVGAVTIWHDVTELSRILVESQRERELLQRLVDTAPIGIALMRGPEHRFEMVNPHYLALFPEGTAAVGRSFAEVFPEVAADGGLERLDRAYIHGETVSMREYAAPIGGGSPRYWDIDHMPLQGPAGTIDGTLTITREVTAQVIARQRVEAIMASLVDGLIISDSDGNFLEMNQAAMELLGAESMEDLQRWLASEPEEPFWRDDDGNPLGQGDCPLARALRGDTFSGYDVMTRRGEHCRICSYSGTAVCDNSGEVVFAFLTLHDITDRKQSEFELAQVREDAERRAAQAEAGEALLQVLIKHVPMGITVADAPDGRIRLVSNYGADLAGQPRETLESGTMDGGPPWQILRPDTLTPAAPEELPLVRSIVQGLTVGDEEWVLRRADGTDIRILCNSGPIIDSQGRVSGAVQAWRDVTQLRAAQAVLERAYQREHRIADVLQRALMPDMKTQVPNYELAARYEPARDESEVGGDFYDVFELSGGRVALVVGDVSGKGLEAAVSTAMATHMIRAYAFEDPEPCSVMKRLNDAISSFLASERFVTVFYGLLDPQSHSIVYADAGHDQPLFYRKQAAIVESLQVTGPVVGILGDAAYTQESLTIESGDILLIYTDGISEAGPHRSFFGQEGIARVLLGSVDSPLQQIADGVISAAAQSSGGHLDDDAAVLVLRSLR